jgi:hypothetical protein
MSDRNGYIRTIYGRHTHTDDDDDDDDDDVTLIFYSIDLLSPPHNRVHILVDCFLVEKVPSPIVLQVVCVAEAVVVALLFVQAHAACVPVFDIKTA